MDAFVSLSLSRDEYHHLVRLLGHHTCGAGLDRAYNRLVTLRPLEASIAESKGPLCAASPASARDLYGDRPVISIEPY
jgi:hypothetical protein